MLDDSRWRKCGCRHPARPARWMTIVLASLAVGCGSDDGLGRRAVSGVVTLDGRPLADGAILLEPPEGESGLAVGATIRRGEFAIGRDKGPVPGSYRARIYSSSGAQAPPSKGQTERTRRPMVEGIPDIYNTRSELRANITADGPNRLRFELRGDVGR